MSKDYHFSNLLYIVHLNLNRHDTGEISVTCRNIGKGTPSSLVIHNRPWENTLGNSKNKRSKLEKSTKVEN